MAGLAKKVLIGASLAAGLSAVAGAPAQALDFTFHGEENIKSYTHQDGNLWVDANDSYLTDNDLTTNVELWFYGEIVGDNVGFTATEGDHTVIVESVTAADWVNFADDWINDLLEVYTQQQPLLQSVWDGLANLTNPLTGLNGQETVKSYLPLIGAGDPNIAEFSLDATGAVDIQMAGWANLWDKFDAAQANLINLEPEVASAINSFATTFRTLIPDIEISEIAKVTINDEVHYAYSFDAEDSGFVAKDDQKSYSGIYSWSKAGVPVASVPEPSTMLGLMAVGGLVAASKRKSNKNA